MIHLFVNALAASAGGGLTYVRNIVPHLAARKDVRTILLVGPGLRQELVPGNNLEVICEPDRLGGVGRYWFEQRSLAKLVRSSGADVLLSAGNFALRNSPVPQILLSRNALYTCPDFYQDLRRRREYRLLLDTRAKAWLAKRSVETADVTVAPSRAFAEELQNWTGRNVEAIHHGFDLEAFFADVSALTPSIRDKLSANDRGFRILFVSHYNYYRNFETLIRAMARAVRMRRGEQLQLILTCTLSSEANPGSYRAEPAARLVDELGVRANIVELGSVPYRQLHHVYRACDMYVTPAYCESFAHPLVEAMSCGLPIVASDIPVHREICESSAVYFPRFSEEDLCARIMQLASSPELRSELGAAGRTRAADFSWSRHVDQVVVRASRLMAESR
jgi:glycosyltransferase involved in cell wall biosynthesis